MSHAVVNRNRVKIERLFKARFFISMSRWIDMVEFLGPLYKMKKKKPTDLMTLSTVRTLAHLCPPVLGWATQSNFAYVSAPQVSFLLLGNESQ